MGDPPEKPLTTRKQDWACPTWPELGSNPQQWEDKRFRAPMISSLNHSSEASSSSLICMCEQWQLWWDCAEGQDCPSLCCSLMWYGIQMGYLKYLAFFVLPSHLEIPFRTFLFPLLVNIVSMSTCIVRSWNTLLSNSATHLSASSLVPSSTTANLLNNTKVLMHFRIENHYLRFHQVMKNVSLV